MRPYEKQLLDERLKHFMREVIPEELLPYLPCLTDQDQQEILAKQTNHGHIRATSVLVDRLKRREEGFPQFVQALRSCGAEHTALLLDPYYKIKGKDCRCNFEFVFAMKSSNDLYQNESIRSSQEENRIEPQIDRKFNLTKGRNEYHGFI